MSKNIKPVGRVKEEQKFTVPHSSDIISQLRSLPIKSGEHFPWPLVEHYVKEYKKNKSEYNCEDYDQAHLPLPRKGYEWYWVSSITKLSGMAGWLEVNVKTKKQGRFEMTRIS
jgi:hypothetical protein